MAPKRKADKYAYVDLTQDQDDDDDVVEVPKKRQRRQKKSAEDDTGAGTSQQPAGAQKPKGKRSSSKASSVEDTQAALEAALAAAPPKPKGRKKAQPDEERRLAPSGATVTYRPRPSQQVQDRIARAMPGVGGAGTGAQGDASLLGVCRGGAPCRCCLLPAWHCAAGDDTM